MEHTYVLVVDHEAYMVALVSDEDSAGRYKMYDFVKNYVREKRFDSIKGFEEWLDWLCENRAITTWGKVKMKE